MKIRRDASIRAVMARYEHILKLSPAQVIKRLKEEELTGYVVLKRRFWWDKKIVPKGMPEVTMQDLMKIEAVGESETAMLDVLNVILSKNKPLTVRKIARLEFVGAFCHFTWFMEQMGKIGKKFNDLNIEPTKEEAQARAGIKFSNYGLYDLVGLFIKIHPQYKREEANLLSWEDVYKALKKQQEDVLLNRNYSAIIAKKKV